MTNSPILAIPEIAPNQNNKYLTHNNAIAWLEGAANDTLTKTLGASAVTLSEAEATKYMFYIATGLTGAQDFKFPSTINGNNAKRYFSFKNTDSVDTATVKASTGSGTTVLVAAGTTAIIYQNHEDMILLAQSREFATTAYDAGFFVAGMPDDGALLTRIIFVRSVSFADDFAGSYAYVGTNPDSSADFDIQKNEVSIGTLTISTLGAATFLTSGGATSFAAGDRLEIFAPSPQDTSMADISVSLTGRQLS